MNAKISIDRKALQPWNYDECIELALADVGKYSQKLNNKDQSKVSDAVTQQQTNNIINYSKRQNAWTNKSFKLLHSEQVVGKNFDKPINSYINALLGDRIYLDPTLVMDKEAALIDALGSVHTLLETFQGKPSEELSFLLMQTQNLVVNLLGAPKPIGLLKEQFDPLAELRSRLDTLVKNAKNGGSSEIEQYKNRENRLEPPDAFFERVYKDLKPILYKDDLRKIDIGLVYALNRTKKLNLVPNKSKKIQAEIDQNLSFIKDMQRISRNYSYKTKA